MSYMFYDCYTLFSLYDNNEISNMKKIYITKSYKSLISIDDYQMNNKLDGIDKESISLSDESETNQSYLNNNSNNLNNSNIYLENSNEISTILEAQNKMIKIYFHLKKIINFLFHYLLIELPICVICFLDVNH